MAKSKSCIGPFSERLETRRLFASSSPLLQYDFTTAATWPKMTATASAGTAIVAQGGFGTIDTEGGTTPSNALRITATPPATGAWASDLNSGQIAVTNTETNLGKLTVGFNLSASQAVPVKVLIYSHNSSTGPATGGLETTIYPAATYYNQRFAVDLSTMTAISGGTFNPAGAFVSFDFQMASGSGWSAASPCQLRLDNVSYSKPAYYVSPAGNDNNNGLTEATAFRTPQRALTFANGNPRVQPGDIILLMAGNHTAAPYDYSALTTAAASFKVGGTPAAWVTMKNYPGQSPTIYSETWNAINIGTGSSTAIDTTTAAISYVEVRGLHVIGDSAKVGSRTAPDGAYDPTAATANQYGPYAQYIGIADGRTNGNGISIDGRYMTNRPHDIRFADNWVQDCAGGGISGIEADRIQVESNRVQDNCYWDIYGTSGISILSAYDFDGTSNVYSRLVRNNMSSGNIHKEMWAAADKYSDGNGIIIDINHETSALPAESAAGRTLVTNNVCFDNGGSGIHAYAARHVDIINNTAYLNSASPYLQYGQIFANGSTTDSTRAISDINIFNNILQAPVANTAGGAAAEPVNGGSVPTAANTLVYKDNVYFGGNTAAWAANAYNIGNVTADPKFVLPSVDPTIANFRLQSTSPAINLGVTTLAPAVDLTNASRYAAPDAGPYEYVPTTPTSVALAAASDTGITGDNKTRFNNASAASKLSFVVSGTISGAIVQLFMGTTLLGSATAAGATTTVTTDGVTALPDGPTSLSALQTFASAPSVLSPTLAVIVDTALPTLVGTPTVNVGTTLTASRSQVRTISWTFSEHIAVPLTAFALVNLATGSAVSLSSRSVSVNGSVVTLTLDNLTADAFPGLFLANGNYRLSLASSVTDDAGNPLDADGDGTVGETPTFDFFKLLGDLTGDRRVDFNDFLLVQNAFNTTVGSPNFNPACDFDGNGQVDFNDFLILQSAFGSTA